MGLINIFDNNIVDLLELNELSNNVHVFIVDMNKYAQNISQFWECISIKEQMRAKSYYTSLLASRYIISHGVLRYILSYYTKRLPQYLEFTYNKYRKPFLRNSRIQFNMSHSHNMVCYVVAFNHQVGIDIERHDSVLDVTELLDSVFTPQEIRFFERIPHNTKIETFYKIWTSKEAIIKAMGKGLYYPINTIDVSALFQERKYIVTIDDNNVKAGLYSYPLKVPFNYSGSLAIAYNINDIVYIESNNLQGIFDEVKFEKHTL